MLYMVLQRAHYKMYGMKWWAKMTQGVKLTSKYSPRLTSKSADSSLTWIHSAREAAHKCIINAFRPLLTCGIIMLMQFIIQSVPLFLTLYGPDLSHCSLTEAPLTLRTREGPYALCLHATHSPQPHETFCHHAFMSPGWTQHHTERLCRFAVCARIFECIHHSVFLGPCTRYTVDMWQVGTKFRTRTICRQASPSKARKSPSSFNNN